MSKHINFFGYTVWVLDGDDQLPDQTATLSRCFYSPVVLAAYSISSNFAISIFLYSLNLSRRGYQWRGRLIAGLSVFFLVFRFLQGVFVASDGLTRYRSEFLIDILVAGILYGTEKPHFDRAIRNGNKPARWWPPLVWILGIVTIEILILKG